MKENQLSGLTSFEFKKTIEAGSVWTSGDFVIIPKYSIKVIGLSGLIRLYGEAYENLNTNHVFGYAIVRFPMAEHRNYFMASAPGVEGLWYNLFKSNYYPINFYIPANTEIHVWIYLQSDGYYFGNIGTVSVLNLHYNVNE